MHNYAIAEIAGYQFRIENGSKVTVPRLDTPAGETVTIDKVLLVNNQGQVTLGTPYVEGAKAEAKVVEHGRSKKVFVFKKKRRKGFRRRATARRHETVLEISGLNS